jgi:hypothetical protein
MKKFRLPRKIKKKLRSGFFLYPEVDGGSLMASPKKNQKDYTAYKQGIVRSFFDETKAERKKSSEELDLKFNAPIEITDKELLEAVNDIFAEQYRKESYNILLRAKKHPIAIKDYHNFVNAWNLIKGGENYGNIACLCIDGAKDNLMRMSPRTKKRK